MRKGLFKKYVRNRYNDGNVKGTIDIARHIEKNTPFTGSVAYSQREFSYDNNLMELVRHTIEFIKRKPYGNKLLKKAKDEVKQIVDAFKTGLTVIPLVGGAVLTIKQMIDKYK